MIFSIFAFIISGARSEYSKQELKAFLGKFRKQIESIIRWNYKIMQ